MTLCPAHDHQLSLGEVARWWTFDPLVSCALALGAGLYARGLVALRARGATPSSLRVASYFAGLAVVALALLSPLDRLSDLFFSAHMGQHELLMLVAPPLLVLGRPLAVAPFGLPSGVRARLLSAVRAPSIARTFRAATHPVVAAAAHGVVLWIWHVPSLFEAALRSEAIHALQHLSFFVTAVLFFWALAYGRFGRAGYGLSVLWVFVTMVHSGALGALLAVAGVPFYPTHAATTRTWHGSPVDDQRLAGLLMWIPAGAVFLVIGLAMVVAWLGEASRRVARAPYGRAP